MLIRKIYSKWAERHRNTASFILHLIGISLVVASLPVLIFRSLAAAAVLFIAGYALQFIGHAVEGNKPGEQLLLERLLRGGGKRRAP